jgi:EGF domain-specific O-GlcNAc transferase
VKERKKEIKTYCKAIEPGDSSLECSAHTQMCRAKNIYFDFKNLKSKGSYDRYREDLFKHGEVGGKCKFDEENFKKQGDHKSPLQSWFSELQTYTEFEFNPLDKCDTIISEPTFLIKLDAGINMYHHFCDFVNLYITQHVNNSFLQNVRIVLWDTSESDYWSYFSDTWKAFSSKSIIHLRQFDGKKVCFKDAVFSLLARMRFGNYYNMPLVNGCHGTSLYRAFSQNVLHRLNVKQKGPLNDKLRVTLLARGTTYRNVLNQDKIIKELKKRLAKEIELNLVSFNKDLPFIEQLKISYNTDIFMSMHGAGLTHLLFLPDWAAVFEIYNCDDRDCYLDLARLRGVKYFTWEDESKLVQQDEGKHPQLGTPHKKFTNYSFDVDEFVRIVKKMIEYVKSRVDFQEARKRLHKSKDEL